MQSSCCYYYYYYYHYYYYYYCYYDAMKTESSNMLSSCMCVAIPAGISA